VERLEVLGACIMGGVSTGYNSGEQHNQRAQIYGGHNGVSRKTLQNKKMGLSVRAVCGRETSAGG
jgi:hypothetical protein